MRRTLRWLATGVVLLGVLTGCTGQDDGGGQPPDDTDAQAQEWFAPCPTPRADTGSTHGDGAGGAPGAAASASPMPAVRLECFGAGEPIDLSQPLGVPTVVNVWASWCRPCREELPAFQAYADQVGGRVHVIGVTSRDTRSASLALAQDLTITFPTLVDEDGELVRSLGRSALPVTLFITPDGRLAHLYNGPPLSESAIAELVEQHLGVKR